MGTSHFPQLGCSVLIAEDDALFARGLQIAFMQANCKVDLARNGIEALKAADERPYDVVVTDYTMPLADGLQVCRGLRAKGDDAIIVVMTAMEVQEQALEAGASSYVSKPLSPHQLLTDIQSMLADRGHVCPPRAPDPPLPEKITENLTADLYAVADEKCMTDERRSAPRRAIRVPVILKRVSDDSEIEGYTVDVGPSSLGIVCVERLEPGIEVRVRLSVEQTWSEGQVVHCADIEGGYRLGFKI